MGPVLKLVLCITVLPVALISWPVIGILGSIVGGAAYGFFSPVLATFKAIEEGRTNKIYHCFYVYLWFRAVYCLILVLLCVSNRCSLIAFGWKGGLWHLQDGTVSTFAGCFTVVRDFKDVCVHSYFSIMSDLRKQGPPNGKYYEIRLAEFYYYYANVLRAFLSFVQIKLFL